MQPTLPRPIQGPRRTAMLLTLALLAMPTLAPSAAADSVSNKDLCDGDLPGVEDQGLETAVVCVNGRLETDVRCNRTGGYHCDVFARASIRVETPQTCGSLESNATTNAIGACRILPTPGDSASTDWQYVETFYASEIPQDGLDVWYTMDLCVEPDKTSLIWEAAGDKPCVPYKHWDWIPPEMPSSLGGILDLAGGLVEQAQNIVEEGGSPITIDP